MLTRRTFLSGTAFAVAAPTFAAPTFAGPVLAPSLAEAASTTLPLDLVNRRHGRRMFAVVSGVDAASGRSFFLGADGRTKAGHDCEAFLPRGAYQPLRAPCAPAQHRR